jgi:hypothetical protein
MGDNRNIVKTGLKSVQTFNRDTNAQAVRIYECSSFLDKAHCSVSVFGVL